MLLLFLLRGFLYSAPLVLLLYEPIHIIPVTKSYVSAITNNKPTTPYFALFDIPSD